MKVSIASIKALLERSLKAAQDKAQEIEPPLRKALEKEKKNVDGGVHHMRSVHFIKALHEELESFYCNKSKNKKIYRIFSRGNTANKKEFGLNELLFDIAVVRTAQISSLRPDILLLRIVDSEWHIESEFNHKTTRELLKDLGKLNMGKAKHSLFIASNGHQSSQWLRDTFETIIGQNPQGNFYLALIPHPSDWHHNYKIELIPHSANQS